MSQNVGFLIENARQLAKNNSIVGAEKKYLEAINELERNNDESKKSKAELWTTKAEYLWFRSFFMLENDSVEDIRKRRIDAIKLLHETSKLDTEYENLKSNVRDMIKATILSIGCIVPETETHVQINCPIKIRNMGAAEFGFSMGMFYKKAECSICGYDIVKDSECVHETGQTYDGKICYVIPKDMTFDHFALTKNPKDPNTGITGLSISKKEFYDKFPSEEIERKIKNNLPLICSLCKQMNIDPSEIDVEKFLSMQNL